MVVRRLHVPRQAPEIDVVALRAIGQRFAMHHRQRYLDALAKLDGRKREILAALPMFFHCNHPLLPGYLRDAPAGIWGHIPSGTDIAAIHRFARSFDASLRPARHDIDAIYLMGSGGSLGHTADSDIDLWVCCDRKHHLSLKPKLRSIEQWALSHGLAVQGFLVDPAFFHDAADTVHGPLLLDEFYRSGIHLTGKQPLWWYVPGNSEGEYNLAARSLFEARFVTADAILDFGPVGQPGLDALCLAGVTELERALQTPHKSLLKLALVETYLNHPERPLLSSHYQTLMRQGTSDVSRLDTYYMLFSYLTSAPTHRPTTFSASDLRELFVRRIVSRGREIPRASQLATEIRSWGYDDLRLQELRQPARMSLVTTLREVELATSLLGKGIAFGRRLGMLSPSQRARLISLESALSGFATPADDDLRPMNPALLPAIRPRLEIRRTRQSWRLLEDNVSVRQEATWAELLLWLTCNHISPRQLRMPTTWFDQAARFWLEATTRPFELLLFFNPLPDPHDGGERVITAFDDPLSYSGLYVCKARMAWCVHRYGQRLELRSCVGERGVLDALLSAMATEGPVEVAGAAFEDMMLVQRVRSLVAQARANTGWTKPLEFAIGRNRYRVERLVSGELRALPIERLGTPAVVMPDELQRGMV